MNGQQLLSALAGSSNEPHDEGRGLDGLPSLIEVVHRAGLPPVPVAARRGYPAAYMRAAAISAPARSSATPR